MAWGEEFDHELKEVKDRTHIVWYASKISKAKSMEIKMNGVDVTESTSYEYFGVTMDKSLTLADHLNKVTKKASWRTNLLNCIHHNVNPCMAKTVYKVMILLVMLNCGGAFINIASDARNIFPQNRLLQCDRSCR